MGFSTGPPHLFGSPRHAPRAPEFPLARKPNYDFQKHRKELDRKAEKAEKLRRKRDKAASQREARENGTADSTVPDESTDQTSPGE